MKEKLLNVLRLIDDEIVEYEGDNLFDEGLLDSLSVIIVVSRIEEAFNIKIDASYVTEKNFKTLDNITALIEQICKG